MLKLSTASKKNELSNEPTEDAIEEDHEDVQSAKNSYLEAGDIRAHFVVDDGSLEAELNANGYSDALNDFEYDVLREAKRLVMDERNKALSQPLNEDEVLAVLTYTSVAVSMDRSRCPYKDLRCCIREGRAVGRWDRFMTHLVKALGKLDQEFGEGTFREKDYPQALFHGLNAVTKVRKFQMGGMQQFNYEGFISTTAKESIAIQFAGGATVDTQDASKHSCIIKLSLNESSIETKVVSSKSTKATASFKIQKPHKFAGFVGNVRWLTRFPDEGEYLIFPLETFPVIDFINEVVDGLTIKRYHVGTGGTSGQLSQSLNLLYASFRETKKPVKTGLTKIENSSQTSFKLTSPLKPTPKVNLSAAVEDPSLSSILKLTFPCTLSSTSTSTTSSGHVGEDSPKSSNKYPQVAVSKLSDSDSTSPSKFKNSLSYQALSPYEWQVSSSSTVAAVPKANIEESKSFSKPEFGETGLSKAEDYSYFTYYDENSSKTFQLKAELISTNETILEFPFDVKLSSVPLDESIYTNWDWLATLFESNEQELLTTYLNKFGSTTLNGFSVKEIEETYNEFGKEECEEDTLRIAIVAGLDSLNLPTSHRVAGGIVQVTSQFNVRFSPLMERTSLEDYPLHSGQGPRVMMPCAHALLLREVSEFDAFRDVIPDSELREKFIKYGFVQWKDSPEDFARLLPPEALQKLRVLFMWAKPELGGEPFIQVFTAAPPIDAMGNAGSLLCEAEIARLLLLQQYRAVAQLAVIRSRLCGPLVRIPLHLTLLGLGAFQNPPEVLQEALQEVCRLLEREKVDLYVHAFDYDDEESSSHIVLQPLEQMGAAVWSVEDFNSTLSPSPFYNAYL